MFDLRGSHYIHDFQVTGNNHIKLNHNGDIYRASPIVYVHNFRSIYDEAYDHDSDTWSSDGFRASDDQNRKYFRTDDTYRVVRGVFSRNSDTGALCLNRE